MLRNVARTLGARGSLKAAARVPSGISRAAHGAPSQTASTTTAVGAGKMPTAGVRRLSESALGEGTVAVRFASVVLHYCLHPLMHTRVPGLLFAEFDTTIGGYLYELYIYNIELYNGSNFAVRKRTYWVEYTEGRESACVVHIG